MNVLLEFFKDETNQLSSTRLVFIIWALSVLFVWVLSCVFSSPMELKEIPVSIQTLIGVLMIGKVAQKHLEKDKNCEK